MKPGCTGVKTRRHSLSFCSENSPYAKILHQKTINADRISVLKSLLRFPCTWVPSDQDNEHPPTKASLFHALLVPFEISLRIAGAKLEWLVSSGKATDYGPWGGRTSLLEAATKQRVREDIAS